ncbi:AraC family transcriptional regulator [Planctomycetota bacterium]|nr:AraC family transcriptional regulator [Planctomycetota bacterium]
MNKAITQEEYQQRILTILIHIQHNLDADLTTESLAELSCFSPYHFHRIFTSITGETVQAYVRRCRLQRSIQQLAYTDQTILEIALAAHYNTHESYTRAFTQQFGFAPSFLRKARDRNENIRVTSNFDEGQPSLSSIKLPITESQMDIQIKTIDPIPVAFIRNVGPYQTITKAYEKLFMAMSPKGFLNDSTKVLSIGYDDPGTTPPEKIRADACFSVSENFEPFGEVGYQVVPGGKYAVATHVGSYDGLKDAYRELYGSWLPKSGHTPRDQAPFEVYVNSPQDTAPEDLITEIHLPLA